MATELTNPVVINQRKSSKLIISSFKYKGQILPTFRMEFYLPVHTDDTPADKSGTMEFLQYSINLTWWHFIIYYHTVNFSHILTLPFFFFITTIGLVYCDWLYPMILSSIIFLIYFWLASFIDWAIGYDFLLNMTVSLNLSLHINFLTFPGLSEKTSLHCKYKYHSHSILNIY